MQQTQPKPIQLTDWHRILAGGTPWEFLLEVVLRAAFTYLLLLVAMRLLGKRVAAQLTLFELSMVVTMAAVSASRCKCPTGACCRPSSCSRCSSSCNARSPTGACGGVASDHEPLDYCEYCGEPRWTEAVTEAGAGEAQSSKMDSMGLARKAG
jgi:hypothetical protein